MGTRAHSVDQRIGTVLAGKYRLERAIGSGGMGVVYESVNLLTERRVAIKVLDGEKIKDREMVRRFRREARAASRTGHKNIVDVLDMGRDEVDGTLYIVQELLNGTDLASYIAEQGTISLKVALEIIIPVMNGIAAAHRHGIVHRDIKPENIFLHRNDDGSIVPKIIDFGISKFMNPGDSTKLTVLGRAMGTACFMSPEQIRGDELIDDRTDIWAMGVVIYEMLSGSLPFDGPTLPAIMTKILSSREKSLSEVRFSVPQDVSDAVWKALEKDRRNRFKTMQSFLDALLDYKNELSPQSQEWRLQLRTTYGGGRDTDRNYFDASDFETETTVFRSADVQLWKKTIPDVVLTNDPLPAVASSASPRKSPNKSTKKSRMVTLISVSSFSIAALLVATTVRALTRPRETIVYTASLPPKTVSVVYEKTIHHPQTPETSNEAAEVDATADRGVAAPVHVHTSDAGARRAGRSDASVTTQRRPVRGLWVTEYPRR